MGIGISVNVGLRPNMIRQAIVKSVSYEEPKWSSCNLQRIEIETMDGLTGQWEMSNYCRVHQEKFFKTKEDILAGKITEGTEITIEYNPNGIMAFWLY